MYMGFCLIYFGVATTLFAANNYDQEFIENNFMLPFHYTEFWSAFLFTLVEAFILVSADISFETVFQKVMVCVVGLNVVTSVIAALIFTFNPLIFERIAHYVEYSSQITVTLANYVFIVQSKPERSSLIVQLAFGTALLIMSILKFLFYVGVIYSPIGAERSSHYFEFIGEMVNSLWAFIFALNQFIQLTQVQRSHNSRLKEA